ncbi:MAG: hypothetical protein L3J71_06135 [Victivallaceae bacterium]|nr:hypothetical protein [Victivallaceae bacterium]
MNIKERIELAGKGLLGILDSEQKFMPTVIGFNVAHDLGRWWDAILRLEEASDFIIPAEIEAASLKNLKRLTDNSYCLLTSRTDLPWLSDEVKKRATIHPHNYRETFIAYKALISRRKNKWAHKSALKLAESMNSIMQEDGSLDFTTMKSLVKNVPFTKDPMFLEQKLSSGWFDACGTSGRALEALIWLYEETNDMPFLHLASRIADLHYRNTINPNGNIREEIISPENPGHNHSYHGTLRGLLLFGLLTGQKKYINAVANTYFKSIRNKIVRESGWAPHDLGAHRCLNDKKDYLADPASAGDSAQLALWLALRAGYYELLDDVERLVRARLLPSQLTEKDIEKNPEQKFNEKELGSWGIHGYPHSEKGCTPDVHAAVAHTLCDIQNNIITENAIGLRINLHFDYENKDIIIKSERKQKANITVVIKRLSNIMIRIPAWTPEESVNILIDDKKYPLQKLETFALISSENLKIGSKIKLSFALPKKITKESMEFGEVYTLKWRGDEIIGITPQDAPLPFYPELKII